MEGRAALPEEAWLLTVKESSDQSKPVALLPEQEADIIVVQEEPRSLVGGRVIRRNREGHARAGWLPVLVWNRINTS